MRLAQLWSVGIQASVAGMPPTVGVPPQAFLREMIKISIDADQSEMIEASAWRVTVRAVNEARQDYEGQFGLDPATGRLQLWVRPGGGAWRALRYLRSPQDVVQGRRHLKAGDELTWQVVVGFDTAERAFVFGEPGSYELRAVYLDPVVSRTIPILESNSVSVAVVAAPDEVADSGGAYTPTVALVAQFGSGHVELGHQAADEAYTFITNFPSAPYAPQVKRGLRRLLESLAAGGSGTPQEAERLKQLRLDLTAEKAKP